MIFAGFAFPNSDFLDWITDHAMLTKKRAWGNFQLIHKKTFLYLHFWPCVGVIMLPALQAHKRLSWPLHSLLYSLVFHCFCWLCSFILLFFVVIYMIRLHLITMKMHQKNLQKSSGFFSFSENILQCNRVMFSIAILSCNYY